MRCYVTCLFKKTFTPFSSFWYVPTCNSRIKKIKGSQWWTRGLYRGYSVPLVVVIKWNYLPIIRVTSCCWPISLWLKNLQWYSSEWVTLPVQKSHHKNSWIFNPRVKDLALESCLNAHFPEPHRNVFIGTNYSPFFLLFNNPST